MEDAHERLSALLSYWIEHNREHEKEFRDWADRVSSARGDVAELLLKAVAGMAEATTWLEKARQELAEVRAEG